MSLFGKEGGARRKLRSWQLAAGDRLTCGKRAPGIQWVPHPLNYNWSHAVCIRSIGSRAERQPGVAYCLDVGLLQLPEQFWLGRLIRLDSPLMTLQAKRPSRQKASELGSQTIRGLPSANSVNWLECCTVLWRYSTCPAHREMLGFHRHCAVPQERSGGT